MPPSPPSSKDVQVKKTHRFLRKGSKVRKSSTRSTSSQGATPPPLTTSPSGSPPSDAGVKGHSPTPRRIRQPSQGAEEVFHRNPRFSCVQDSPGNPFVITPVRDKILFPKTALPTADPPAPRSDHQSVPTSSVPLFEPPVLISPTSKSLTESVILPPSPTQHDEHFVSSEQVDHLDDYSQGNDEHHISSEQVDDPVDYSQEADCIRKDLSTIDELVSSEQVESLDYSQGAEQVGPADYSVNKPEQAHPGYSQGNEQVGTSDYSQGSQEQADIGYSQGDEPRVLSEQVDLIDYSQGQERVDPSGRSQVDEHRVSSEQVAGDYSQDKRSSTAYSPSKRGGRSSPLRFLSARRPSSPVKPVERYPLPLRAEFLDSSPVSLAKSGTRGQARAAIDRRLAESGLVKAPLPPMDLKEAILARGRSFMEKKRSSMIAEAAIASRRRMEGRVSVGPPEAMPGSIYPAEVTGRSDQASGDTMTITVLGDFQPIERKGRSENHGMDSDAEDDGGEVEGGTVVGEQTLGPSGKNAQAEASEVMAFSERFAAGRVQTIRKGKSRMSLEQMNEYNAELHLPLGITSPNVGSSSSARFKLDAVGEQDDGSPKRATRAQENPGVAVQDDKVAVDTSSPAILTSGSRTPSSFYQVQGDSYESSNYMVSPSKLPLDPPSFSDICSSTFVYEDRLPSGDKVHRPALILGKEHTASRLGLQVYPKRRELRSPPSIDLSSPPGRMLKPGQANDLYEPPAGPVIPGQHRNELYKPRDPIEYSWLFRSMYSDNASDASVTLDYEWESESDAGKQRSHGKSKSSKTRRYTKHTRGTRAMQRGEDHLRKLERSEKIRLADLARQQEVEAFLQGEPIAPLEFSTDRIGLAVAPGSSDSPGQGRSVRRGERVGMYTSGSQSSDEAATAVKTAKEDLSSSSSRSRGQSENGMLVAAIRSRENWLPLQQVQASPARRSQQGRHPSEASPAKSPKETKEYYRALIDRLNRPITAQPGHDLVVKTSVRPSHQSSEEDQEEGAVNSAVTPMLGSIGAVAQRGATTEEDSDAAASRDGSKDEHRGLAAAGADGESAPPSPEYRGLPRRLNGVSQNRLSESFLRAEASKRKASPASLSPIVSPLMEGDTDPSQIQGRGSWRDGRSRHGFPPPETPRKWVNLPIDSSTPDLDDPFVFRPVLKGAVDGLASPSEDDAAEDDLLSSPEAVKDTTIPMVDPKSEGAVRSPDSPAMHFDPEFDLPRRRRTLADGNGMVGMTPVLTESKRVRGAFSESPALSSLLDRLKRRVEERSQSPSLPAASQTVDHVHEAAYQNSMSIIQDFKRERVGSTPALISPVDNLSNAHAADGGSRIRWLPIERTDAATGKLQRAFMPMDLDKPKKEVNPERLFWTPVPGEETTATSFNSDDLKWETVSSIRPRISGPQLKSPDAESRDGRIWDVRSVAVEEDLAENFASPSSELERKIREVFGDWTTLSAGVTEGGDGFSKSSPAQGEVEAEEAGPAAVDSVSGGIELSSKGEDGSKEGDHQAFEDQSFARVDAKPSLTSGIEVAKASGEATTTPLGTPIRNLLIRIKERQNVVGEISPPRREGLPAGPGEMPIMEWSVAQDNSDDACIAQQAGADQGIDQADPNVIMERAEDLAESRERSDTLPLDLIGENDSRMGRMTVNSPGNGTELSAESDAVELESRIFYSQAYLEKLSGDIQSAEERLQRARDELFAVILAAQPLIPSTPRTRASRLGPLSKWIWLLLFGVMAYTTYVWWNQSPDFMDPFYTTQAPPGQVWIMKAFGRARELCEAGFRPACWVWNPSQQQQQLYSRRFTFTPI